MEFASIFAQLARHRTLTLLGILPALLAGLVVALHISPSGIGSGTTTSATATAQVLLKARDDSPADLDPRAAESVAERAQLIGDLMATQTIRRDIARGAGIRSSLLAVATPTSGEIEVAVPIAIKAAAAGVPRTRYVLSISADSSGPIITLRAAAPTSSSAIAVLRAAEDSLAGVASRRAFGPRSLSVVTLGRPQGRVYEQSANKKAGVAAAIVVFGLWCVVVVLGAALLPGSGPQGRTGLSVSSQ